MVEGGGGVSGEPPGAGGGVTMTACTLWAPITMSGRRLCEAGSSIRVISPILQMKKLSLGEK